MNFTLQKLGPKRADGRPDILDNVVHAAANLEAAINSAKHLVKTTFNIPGVAGFRLLNNNGVQVFRSYLGDNDD